MKLSIETFWQERWHESAQITIANTAAGNTGPTTIEYDMNYFAEVAAAEGYLQDARALSVRYPVNLTCTAIRTWPPFLLDLMPQGRARQQFAEVLGMRPNGPESELGLLLHSAGNPIGNIRIKEAAEAERRRIGCIQRAGFTKGEILAGTDRFLELFESIGLTAASTYGLQGEWPKLAMTRASDGLYYPDGFVSDDEAEFHVIVKLPRSRGARDRLILHGEAGYADLARELGLRAHGAASYSNGVLIIPRFDRDVIDGRVVRYGQESLASAKGAAEFGHLASHEDYIAVIRSHSDVPDDDIAEYLKRDIANQAFGNPDNHGRNSALSKGPDGSVRLAPVFDFAPMRMSDQGIARSTRWGLMRDLRRDTNPDWRAICQAIYPESQSEADALLEELVTFAIKILEIGDLARFGIPEEVSRLAAPFRASVARCVIDAYDRPIEAPAGAPKI